MRFKHRHALAMQRGHVERKKRPGIASVYTKIGSYGKLCVAQNDAGTRKWFQ